MKLVNVNLVSHISEDGSEIHSYKMVNLSIVATNVRTGVPTVPK